MKKYLSSLFLFLCIISSLSAQNTRKYGLITLDGEEVTPLIFERIEWVKKDNKTLVKVKIGSEYTIADPLGNILLPKNRTYQDVSLIRVNSVNRTKIIGVRKNDKWALLDSQFNEITPFEYDYLEAISDSLLKAKKNNLYAVITPQGKKITPFIYSYIGNITDGFIPVKTENEQRGLIYQNGTMVIPYQNQGYVTVDASGFLDKGLAVVTIGNDKSIIIDSIGNIRLADLEYVLRYDLKYPNIGEIRKNGLYGLISSQAEIIVEPIYTKIECDFDKKNWFYQDKIVYTADSTWTIHPYKPNSSDLIGDYLEDPLEKIINSKGYKRGYYTDYKSHRYRIVSKGSTSSKKFGIIDSLGNIVMPLEYNYIEEINEGRYRAYKGTKLGLVDIYGKELIPQKFIAIRDFSGDPIRYTAYTDDKASIYDNDGREVISCTPDNKDDVESVFKDYRNGTIGVKKNDKNRGVADIFTGKLILPCIYSSIYSDRTIRAQKEDLYYLFDLKGNPITNDAYTDFEMLNNGKIMVKLNDKWGVIDEKGNIIVPFEYHTMEYWVNDILLVSK